MGWSWSARSAGRRHLDVRSDDTGTWPASASSWQAQSAHVHERTALQVVAKDELLAVSVEPHGSRSQGTLPVKDSSLMSSYVRSSVPYSRRQTMVTSVRTMACAGQLRRAAATTDSVQIPLDRAQEALQLLAGEEALLAVGERGEAIIVGIDALGRRRWIGYGRRRAARAGGGGRGGLARVLGAVLVDQLERSDSSAIVP